MPSKQDPQGGSCEALTFSKLSLKPNEVCAEAEASGEPDNHYGVSIYWPEITPVFENQYLTFKKWKRHDG